MVLAVDCSSTHLPIVALAAAAAAAWSLRPLLLDGNTNHANLQNDFILGTLTPNS